MNENDDLASGIDKISSREGAIDHEIDTTSSGGLGTILLNTAPAYGGNSGGPLVDAKGGVIGVVASGASADPGMNAAVSVKEVVKLLDRNDIPYTTVAGLGIPWYVYAIIVAAIAAVAAVIVVMLRKRTATAGGPKGKNPRKEADGTAPKTAQTQARILVGVAGPLANQRFTLKAGEKLVIGRDAKRCKVVFPNGTEGVSNVHCVISFDGQKATITDMNSTYGTFVDKKKLAPNTATHLHRGLSVDIGTEKNRFTLQ